MTVLNETCATHSDARAAAHAAIDLGYWVFPVSPAGQPIIADWRESALADHTAVEFWWNDHPDAQVGIPAGHGRSELFGIQTATRDELERELSPADCPQPAATFENANGSWAALFRVNDGYAIQSQEGGIGLALCPGARVIGTDGFIVLTPAAVAMLPDTGNLHTESSASPNYCRRINDRPPPGAVYTPFTGRLANDNRQGVLSRHGQTNEAAAAQGAAFTFKPYVRRDPSTIPMRPWLYDGFLIRNELSLTIAPGGVGKSSVGLMEAIALASGRPLLGVPVEKKYRVAFFSGEEPQEELERRIEAICKHYGLDEAETNERLFVNSGLDSPLTIAEQTQNGAKILHPVVDRFVSQAKHERLDAIFVDPFVSVHTVNESDPSSMQQAAAGWKSVAYGAGIAVSIAHHSRKLNDRVGTVDDARGGSSLADKARATRVLNQMSDKTAQEFGIRSNDRKRYIWVDPSAGRSSMVPTGGDTKWFHMASVSLGNGTAEKPDGDSVGVIERWHPPTSGDASPLPAEKVEELKARLRTGFWLAAPNASISPWWVGVAIAEVFAIDRHSSGWKLDARMILDRLIDGYGVVKVQRRDPADRQEKWVALGAEDATDSELNSAPE